MEFWSHTCEVWAFETAVGSPPSSVTNVSQCPLPAAAKAATRGVMKDLGNCGVVTRMHSPSNSPAWPVCKLDSRWPLPVDYRRLNCNTRPLAAAVPSTADLLTPVQAAHHAWMATVDAEDVFFMIPLQQEDKPQFAFPWEGVQCTLNQLPPGSQHSPAAAHQALAKALGGIKIPGGVSMDQCIADSLIGGDS